MSASQAASSSLLHRMHVPLGFRTADGGLEEEAPERAARRMIRAELNVEVHRRCLVRGGGRGGGALGSTLFE